MERGYPYRIALRIKRQQNASICEQSRCASTHLPRQRPIEAQVRAGRLKSNRETLHRLNATPHFLDPLGVTFRFRLSSCRLQPAVPLGQTWPNGAQNTTFGETDKNANYQANEAAKQPVTPCGE